MEIARLLPPATVLFLLVIGILVGAALQKMSAPGKALISRTVWSVTMGMMLLDSSLTLTMLFISVVHILKRTSI
jgi:hypothetical protein